MRVLNVNMLLGLAESDRALFAGTRDLHFSKTVQPHEEIRAPDDNS